MQHHWIIPHMGKEWVSGARGPDKFDCWGLVFHIYKTILKIDLPELPGIDAKNRLQVCKVIRDQEVFEPVENLEEFDVIVMGRVSQGHHVGLYTKEQGGGVVHCQEHFGVVFVPIHRLNIQGYRNINYLRHAEMFAHKRSA